MNLDILGVAAFVAIAEQGSFQKAARTLYIDWPGWAGRGQKEQGGGATVLAFAPDKPEYAPGETVTLAIPTPSKGRGLVSLEHTVDPAAFERASYIRSLHKWGVG
jgi:hypothetical protein